MENPNAGDKHKKSVGIFQTRKKKGDKTQSKHIASNKFYILYKSKDHEDFYSTGNK